MQAKTIDDVVTCLDTIIVDAQSRGSRVGYFAALYHHVAIAFRDAIAAGTFADNARMERLDVIFFNRYLTALHRALRGARPSRSWHVAFRTAAHPEATVLQHLLLGMNAHINFDLGIAVAETCKERELPSLRADFDKMNALLSSLLGGVEADLAVIWPPFEWLQLLGAGIEDGLINFSMRDARQHAWELALRLAARPARERAELIAAEDESVADLAHDIRRPGLPLNLALAFIRAHEHHDVAQTIDILLNHVGPAKSRGLAASASRLAASASRPRRAPESPVPAPAPRRKIAVLGGGVGALSTVFALTDPDNPQRNEYDITVYQMGWRLGGKGASGRSIEEEHRIEEHGLHLWFGSYDNAFRIMQHCYAELGRAPDAPLAGWNDAFVPHSFIVLKEWAADRWHNWQGDLPTNDLIPGEGSGLLPLWEYMTMACEIAWSALHRSTGLRSPTGDVTVDPSSGWWRAIEIFWTDSEALLAKTSFRFLHWSHRLAALLHLESELMLAPLGLGVEWTWRRLGPHVTTDDEIRHTWVLCNFFYANARGVIAERAVSRGLDVLNDYDYREFLLKYAYDDGGLMANSAWVLGIYDGVFAYVDGDNRTPAGAKFPPKAQVEAGNVIRAGIRQFLAYSGASIWKMQGGMGDTVFAPLYDVLRQRGVKFEFFHKVKRVVPSPDGRRVERIEITRQVDLKPEQQQRGGYEPLIEVKGLPCWPSTPRYGQLVDGETLRREGVDLESYANNWPPAGEVVLEVDKDFDDVVLGISLGAIPYVACDLVRASDKWKRMVDGVQTIRTQAFQLWLRPTAFELGWKLMQRPVLTCFEVSPFNTWADMSHLIEREVWHAASPLNLSYFCGPMLDDGLRASPCGPVEDVHQFDQRAQNSRAKAEALRYLENDVQSLWPHAVTEDKKFRWELLVDRRDAKRRGAERFDGQYWRANVQPSERYVLSVPGSSKLRLPAHDPAQFTNLFLAGDWTDNGFNLGCVEAAVMSGLLASHALSGFPPRRHIVGLNF